MSKFSGFIFLLALMVFTGCETAPPPPVPMVWSATTNAVPPISKAVIISTNRTVKLMPITNLPPLVRTNVPVPTMTNIVKIAPMATWTSLERWTAKQKIDKPRLVYRSPVNTYAVLAGKNLMTFSVGSREAAWNGISINLGFDPEMVDGEIYLHGLDLQKNLLPLLCEPPVSFPNTNRVIVIDPGHGGANGGTTSVLDKHPEKEFTLDVAERLQPLLEQAGWKVFLTRTNDLDLSLSNRVAFAEAHHADCFISLHFNSSAPDKKQNGLETYCLTPTGMPSTLTRGFADPWSENLPNNNFDEQNLKLAVALHKAILRATNESDRGVRRARFIGVLRGQNRPAILIEGGYLSNPGEAARIENPDFRQKLAAAIAGALK